MTRTPAKAAGLRQLGAEPVVCDVFAAAALTRSVVAFGPDLVIHQLTDLPDTLDALAAAGDANARMRREGTANLLAAARAAAARRFVAQSVAWDPSGDGAVAKRELEQGVLDFGGVVIRYGQLYGPGTFYPDSRPGPPCIQVDAAVRRTVALLDLPAQIVTLTDELQ